jgi:type II secretory pathway component HofQ
MRREGMKAIELRREDAASQLSGNALERPRPTRREIEVHEPQRRRRLDVAVEEPRELGRPDELRPVAITRAVRKAEIHLASTKGRRHVPKTISVKDWTGNLGSEARR